MIAKDTSSAARLRAPSKGRRVDLTLGLSRGDPGRQPEYVSPTDSGRFAMIGELESSVSLIQTARLNLDKIEGWLAEMKQFLEEEGYRSFKAQIPVSVINNFLTDRLAHIRVTAETASFRGRALLNGKSGAKGVASGEHLRFIRGSARVRSSGSGGYPIAVYQAPRPAVLTGSARLSPDDIKKESVIALADEAKEVRYKIRGDENAESLVANLQQYLVDHGFDISVYRTPDNHLYFRHNQLGAAHHFWGMSAYSRLISEVPGRIKQAEPGVDIAGQIGGETAGGEGGFLSGVKGNRLTDGLVVYYDGELEYPGQVVGCIEVEQNGIHVPVDLAGTRVEILSIPSVRPEQLAVGVSNRSGFDHLGDIRANTVLECRDAIRLIEWSMDYLAYLQDELKWHEGNYIERAVALLRTTMSPSISGEEIVHLSQEKAQGMASELKGLLGQTIGGFSSWQ